jgi:hypothetical protein
MFLITDYFTYRDYFKAYAVGPTKHKELKSFYLGDSRAISDAALSNIDYYCLWLEDPDINPRGIGHDSETCQFIGAFVILGNCPPDDHERREQIKNETMAIALQAIAKMKKDFQERLINIDPDSFEMNAISSMFADTAVGWRVEFRINDPIQICFDASKWDS